MVGLVGTCINQMNFLILIGSGEFKSIPLLLALKQIHFVDIQQIQYQYIKFSLYLFFFGSNSTVG